MTGIMVVAAFAVALALLIGGFVHSRFGRGGMFLEGLGGFIFAEVPGAVGLALAPSSLMKATTMLFELEPLVE